MATTDRELAIEFIQQVARDNGWLSPETRERMLIQIPEAVQSYDGMRNTAASTASALSENLYSKPTRFVYELIQNAEDNKYSRAREANESPFLNFTVSENRIVVESNEDGFSKENVVAISKVGKSTKTNQRGYIGEKGIGFKSVFTVAQKVHVQSGPYSFAFYYDNSTIDGALGMITPLFEEPEELPTGVRTRIVLHLKPDKNNLFPDFENLPHTLLLFLDKLKKLTICLKRPGKDAEKREYSLSSTPNRACIHVVENGKQSDFNYWTFSRPVTNMPEEEKRAKTETSERITEATVVLAFPVDQTDYPLIEARGEQVFAFLPIRRAGFKFLIQSDFITSASREDVLDCEWNRRLLDETANLFVASVDTFLMHPTLKYNWVRYFSTDAVPDEFWGRLRRRLFLQLREAPKFLSYDGKARRPSKLRFVGWGLVDHSGSPLLPDCNCSGHADAYLADEYDRVLDRPTLRMLGVTDLTTSEFIHRLSYDLGLADSISKWKSTDNDSPWHGRMASVLIEAIKIPNHLSQIDILRLVPLVDGKSWVWTRNATLYLPTYNDIDIPTDLPAIHLVDPGRLRQPVVQELFKLLGVQECLPETVFPFIKERSQADPYTVNAAANHLKFIYRNHDRLPDPINPMRMVSSDCIRFWPHSARIGWTYRPMTHGNYCAADIIDQPLPEELKKNMRFLHPLYYEVLGKCECRHDKTGTEWLEHFHEIKSEPQLQRRDVSGQISHELKYIACQKPHRLFGVLKSQWQVVCKLSTWRREFKALSIRVPILDSDATSPLSETYLPLPRLKEAVAKLGLERDFGFIEELKDITDNDAVEWKFLGQLGVGMEEDIHFWIKLLKKARQSEEVTTKETSEIYSNLQRLCVNESHKNLIRSLFGVSSSIFASGNKPGTSNLVGRPSAGIGENKQTDYVLCLDNEWRELEDCVWNAPEWYRYDARISSIANYKRYGDLFKGVLDVRPKPTPADYLDYLVFLKQPGFEKPRTEQLSKIYDELHMLARSKSEPKARIKDRFVKDELVYDFDNKTWHSPSNCIWVEDRIHLPSKFSVATQYRSQQSFFCDVLDIPAPELETYITGLIEVAKSSPSIEMVKQMIGNICQFDPTESSLSELDACKCFPIRRPDGTRKWMDSYDNFAIIDRAEYGRVFSGRIKVLEFTLEEVHAFEKFIYGLRLEDQLLSRLVVAETTATSSAYDTTLTKDLRRKAYAICRYVMHHQSDSSHHDPDTLFSKLKSLEVHVTETISKTLSVRLSSKTVSVTAEKANLHFMQDEDTLKIYIPKDPARRRLCMSRELPLTLLKCLNATRGSAGDLASILWTQRLESVDSLLEDAGIISITGIHRPEGEDDDSESETLYDDINGGSESATVQIQPRPRTSQQHLSPGGDSDYFNTTPSPRRRVSSGGYISTPATSVFDSPHSPVTEYSLYKILLGCVVDGARSLTGMPFAGRILPIDTSSSALVPSEVDIAVAGQDRNSKIGAAGELFVFEWLKGMDLPGFGVDSWQSKIRDLVCQHDDYQNMEPWRGGRETSDIVYDDHEGKFTNLLINHGHLKSEHWTGRHPRYFIEVKATTSTLGTVFFSSSKQYEMMGGMMLPESGASDEVYLIVRVFLLGQPEMGLKLYVDPARLEDEGRLIFEMEKRYRVTAAVQF